ncbi:MAG: hypothetical protein ACREOQ_17185 [Gemmatimonadales bacterium]
MGVRPIVLVILATVLAGCADERGYEDRLAPEFGLLEVSTATSGDAPDPDGYGLGVDGGGAVTDAPPTGTVWLGLPPGRHALRLLGVAPQCRLASDSVVQVDLTTSDTVPVSFDVVCSVTGVPATVKVTGGGAQVGVVATELPGAVVVRVTEASTVAVPNQLVEFVPVKGGGSVTVDTVRTDSSGQARARWTLGTVAGEQALEARAIDPTTGAALAVAKVTADAWPGPVAHFDLVADSVLLTTDANYYLWGWVTGVVDAFGNPPLTQVFTVTVDDPTVIVTETNAVRSAHELETTARISAGSASAPIRLTFLRPLIELQSATGGYRCAGTPALSLRVNGSSTPIEVTSIGVAVVVDSLSYPDDGASPTLWTTETRIFQPETGPPIQVGPTAVRQETAQVPNRLAIGGDWLHLVSETPLSYSGPAPCGASYHFANPANRPFTLTQPNPVFPYGRPELRASSSAPGRLTRASAAVDHLGR